MKQDKNIYGRHIPIMINKVLEGLDIKVGDKVGDLTINRAGHSIEFARIIGKSGVLIGNDLDRTALQEAEQNIKQNIAENNTPKYILINDNFKNIKNNIKKELGEDFILDKIFLDLGVSSQELDISGRGFSFLKNEPLQMTFKSEISEDDISCKDIINYWTEDSISDILYNFADEKYAKRIAKSIIDNRDNYHRDNKEIETTFQLLEIIKSALPSRELYKKAHWATKTFQALRMAVNDEIGNIIFFIEDLNNILKSKGRIAFLTFHSVEDRIVKVKMKELNNFIPINKRVIIEDIENIKHNPRARSAKLRIYEKQ